MTTSKRKTNDKKKQGEPAAQQVVPPPSFECIQKRAFEIYQALGCIDGRDMDHWLQAEMEIRMELELQFKVEQLLNRAPE